MKARLSADFCKSPPVSDTQCADPAFSTPPQSQRKPGNWWRQENQFRYSRIHFDLESLGSHSSSGDDEERMVTSSQKTKEYAKVLAAKNHHTEAKTATEAALLGARTLPPGTTGISGITFASEFVNTITYPEGKPKPCARTPSQPTKPSPTNYP